MRKRRTPGVRLLDISYHFFIAFPVFIGTGFGRRNVYAFTHTYTHLFFFFSTITSLFFFLYIYIYKFFFCFVEDALGGT